MLRMTTGYVFMVCFFSLFMIFIVGIVNESEEFQTVEQALEEGIKIDTIHLTQNSYLYDRNEEVFSVIQNEENRKYIEFEQIPNKVIQAFLAVEDQYFYEHEGVDIGAVIRAFIVNARAQAIEEGASTITQQVARNLFLNHEQTYNRKLSEVLYSYQLEQKYSKQDILELYVNTVYFSNGVYGFETASHAYFNKPSQELSLAEIAFLVAIPANPSHYDPLTNIENTLLRQKTVLERMAERGVIAVDEKEEALEEEIHIQFTQPIDSFPHYASYVEQELKDLISIKEGFQSQLQRAENQEEREEIQQRLNRRIKEVLASGVHIHTSLHPRIQSSLNNISNRRLSNWNVQGAAAVIDHASHQIVAIYGGNHFQKYDFHRASQAYRQPGSAIKPLLVFGPYMNEKNKSLHDRVSIHPICRDGYCPDNASGTRTGSVTLSDALAYSYNTAAVRLIDQTGLDTAFSYLDAFHFSRIVQEDKRYPAALGGFTYGMTPLELTSAFTVFSNDGMYRPSYAIEQVTDKDGNVLYEWSPSLQPVWEKETNDQLRYMLNQVVMKGTARSMNIRHPNVGGKTGTTNETKDLWFIGYNDRYTLGVWLGQDNPTSLRYLPSTAHLQWWKDIYFTLE